MAIHGTQSRSSHPTEDISDAVKDKAKEIEEVKSDLPPAPSPPAVVPGEEPVIVGVIDRGTDAVARAAADPATNPAGQTPTSDPSAAFAAGRRVDRAPFQDPKHADKVDEALSGVYRMLFLLSRGETMQVQEMLVGKVNEL